MALNSLYTDPGKKKSLYDRSKDPARDFIYAPKKAPKVNPTPVIRYPSPMGPTDEASTKPVIKIPTSKSSRTIPTTKIKPLSLPANVREGGLKEKGKFDWGKATSAGAKLAPYASNIINATRTAPMPRVPNMVSSVTLDKINMNNDRSMVERGVRAANTAAANSLDANTAAAVQQSTLATRFDQLSTVNQAERNSNAQVSNEQAKINSGIQTVNMAKLDTLNDNIVERQVAQQRAQSENIANVGDKFIGIQNEKAKQALEEKKYGYLMKTDQNGTLGRAGDSLDDPMYKAWQKQQEASKKTYKNGGGIKSFNTKRMMSVLSK